MKCIRDDGTDTWQPSTPYFAFHDLIHYAVETTLEYSEAFFGVVNKGKALDEFGTREGKRDHYTCEEIWAEHIVALLQFSGWAADGGAALTEPEFLEQLQNTFSDHRCGAPAITKEQLRSIRHKMDALYARWASVKAGELMELEFP